MNYNQYLQGGEEAQQQDSAMQELVDLVNRALNQDSEAGEQLRILLENAPELEETVVRIAESLQSESTPSMKCGGKTSKKQLGGINKKAKKAGCGCVLRKVGGRLIEVDGCTGLPVHKTGAKVKKYQSAATGDEGIQPAQPEAPATENTEVTAEKTNAQLWSLGQSNYNSLSDDEKARFQQLVSTMNSQFNPAPQTTYDYNGKSYTTIDAANLAYNTDAAQAQKARNTVINNTLGFTPRSQYYKNIVNAATAYEDGTDLVNRRSFMNEMKDPNGKFAGLNGQQRRKAWRLYKGLNTSNVFDNNPLPEAPKQVTVSASEPAGPNIDWNQTVI